jgi:CheY-like chemotaxis protein
MYTQVDRTLQRSEGGLGIGLALVKRLVDMHGGNIEAKSDGPGQGSEFIVRLPVDLATQQQRATAGPKPLIAASNFRVLVVDDNRDAADSLGIMLRMTGNQPQTAYDGATAIQAAEEFHPHVVLLDIGLPKLNGHEVAQHIRQQFWGQQMVLIAVTGWGQEEDKKRSKDAGFDHHMVKPAVFATLMALLAELPSPVAERA